MNLHGEALRDFHDGDVRAFTMRRTRNFTWVGYSSVCMFGLSVILQSGAIRDYA